MILQRGAQAVLAEIRAQFLFTHPQDSAQPQWLVSEQLWSCLEEVERLGVQSSAIYRDID